MSKTINLGIDLGTTNSAICYFDKGEVKIFKDPITWKDTLPSVVGFKKDRIIVGQKAKEYMEKRPQDVVAFFKRKMGTNETYKIKSLSKSITPIELSSYVLKELKTFIQDDNILADSVVITIPASFDTIQSNATKQAGELAGFKEVILLQEPIAASLAYANSKKRKLEGTKWLVYDLGGGTFDVALLSINDGEMKVIDHEGDNFLGGSDFDRLIVEKIVIPYLEDNFEYSNLKNEFQNASGRYNKIYYKLLYLAEQVKIQLSTKTSAEIEFEFEDEDIYFTITRNEFEKIIKNEIIKTADMIKQILTRNSLRNDDIDFVLMVGGSTYIPFVRKYIKDVLDINILTDIDPTTAVAIGAAYYAGTKKKQNNNNKTENKTQTKFKIKMAYEKATQEDSEFVAIRVDGDVSGFNYRIIREDGGFDSGLRPLKNKLSEDLPLLKDNYNFFTMTIFDNFNNAIQTESIEIAQGKYSIAGQPLPEDISLEVDDIDGKTKLELVFKKGAILPLKKTITKEINKTIIKNSNEAIIINILEGDSNSLPTANKSIGFLKIDGNDIERDIVKGADLEIIIEMSESRDLTISAYIPMTDQEFKEIFNPKNREVHIDKLSDEIYALSDEIDKSLDFAKQNNEYEKVDELYSLKTEISKLEKEISEIDEDNTSDKRYQLEDKKRKIAQEYFNAIKDEKINKLKNEYLELKPETERLVAQYGDYADQEYLKEITEKEIIYLNSNNIHKVQELLDELLAVNFHMKWKEPDFIKGAFAYIVSEKQDEFKGSSKANMLIGRGMKAFENENIQELADITRELFQLLPEESQSQINKIGFN